MKILFIQFPWADLHKRYEELAKTQGNEPPLGICYLAAIAEKKGHKIKIIDSEVEMLGSSDKLIKEVLEFNPDIIGITSTTPCFHKIEPFARAVKKIINPTIIVGGPHISVLKDKAFSTYFDFGVYGEGEITFSELLEMLGKKGKKNFSKINGLIFWNRSGKKEPKLTLNPPREYIKNLDSIPFPARHYLNPENYTLSIPKKGVVKITNIMAMRGCPFQCVFCAAQTMWGYCPRFRSGNNVVDEMEHVIRTQGIYHFVFTDSTLTLSRKLITDICNEIIKRKLNITWEGWTRANLIDEELIKLMKESGFVRISFGIESGDPKILKIIKKEVSHKDIRNAYKLMKKYDIESTCSVMIGHPGETKKSVMKTINFVRNIPEIRYSPLSIAVPYPGTELEKMAKKGEYGLRLLSEDYTKYSRYDNVVMCVNDLGPKDLVRYQKFGMLYINLTPRRIWYHLRRTNLKDAIKHGKALMRIFIG